MLSLSSEQQENIKRYLEKFEVFMKTEKGLEWQRERKDRIKLFQKLLSKEHPDNLTEEDFARIIKNLWATDFWRNKDYLVRKLREDNDLEKLRKELRDLIYGTEPLEARFDKFKSSIKGLGPSSITEILLFVSPNDYCLWNDKPKNVLPFLKIRLLPERVYKHPIVGSEYIKCNAVLSLIRDEMRKYRFESADFVDVDFLLAFIFYEVLPTQPRLDNEGQVEKSASKAQFYTIELPGIELDKLNHSGIQGILLELGNMLGYDTYVADPSKTYKGKELGELSTLKKIPQFTYQRLLDTVKNIDVIWFEEEWPRFCFEIEHTTGVTLGLLRLYQIRKITNAKFFVIAPENIISKFQTEISKDPFHQIRRRYIFRSHQQLVDMFDSAFSYHRLKREFFNKD